MHCKFQTSFLNTLKCSPKVVDDHQRIGHIRRFDDFVRTLADETRNG